MLYLDKECSEETIDRRVEMRHQPIKLEPPPKTKKIFHQFSKTSAPGDFLFPNFVKLYQPSKAPSSCLGTGQIFVGHEIRQIFRSTSHNLEKLCNQEN